MTPTTHAARKALTDLDQTIMDYRHTVQELRGANEWAQANIWEAKADTLDLQRVHLRNIFCEIERETTDGLHGFAARVGL